jgi:hypothetical protein
VETAAPSAAEKDKKLVYVHQFNSWPSAHFIFSAQKEHSEKSARAVL